MEKHETKGSSGDSGISSALDATVEAVRTALEEQWEGFVGAIARGEEELPVSISLAVKFKPGKDDDGVRMPGSLLIESKAGLPSVPVKMLARMSGKQLALFA